MNNWASISKGIVERICLWRQIEAFGEFHVTNTWVYWNICGEMERFKTFFFVLLNF